MIRSSNPFAQEPRYELITRVLRSNIQRGTLPEGLVLLEGPIAAVMQTSRVPEIVWLPVVLKLVAPATPNTGVTNTIDVLVQAEILPDATVPSTGAVNVGVVMVGAVANTAEPVPVSSVSAARKFALDGVVKKVATPVPKPDTPDATGKPVQLVNVPDAGVPRVGVTSCTLLV